MNKQTKALAPSGKANRGKIAPYVKKASAEVTAWENEKPGFLLQVGDFLLWPAEKAAEALIPESVTEAVSNAIERALSLLASQTTRTFDPDAIRASVKARIRRRR